MGHKYRSEALRKEAVAYKHNIATVGDIYRHKPVDWLIADVIRWEEIPEELVELCHKQHTKIALLNGVGHKIEEGQADFVWIQDKPERVILRRELFQNPWYNRKIIRRHNRRWWFVFGGATDSMGLLPAFVDAMEHNAWLVTTELTPDYSHITTYWDAALHGKTKEKGHSVWQNPIKMADDNDLFSHMYIVQNACVAMGMTAWEFAAIRKHTYVFSISEEHLHFAQNMADMGLVKAYPKVGIPSAQEIKDFLVEWPRYRMNKKYAPDGNGATRLLMALEKPQSGYWTKGAWNRGNIKRILL